MSAYTEMLKSIWNGYHGLSVYEMMMKANLDIITGGKFTDADINLICNNFINNADLAKLKQVNHEKSANMNPIFYHTAEKLVTVSTVTPKTQLLSGNSYELEILRLLALFCSEDEMVGDMLKVTYDRLKNTCFGRFCPTGECFDLSIVTLRFLNTAFPLEVQWMEKLINGIKVNMHTKKRHSGTLFYYWLTLSELPIGISKREIERYSTNCTTETEKIALPNLLRKSYILNSDHDKYATPFGVYVMRNCLSKLDDYKYIENRKPYVSTKDGRMHFNMEDSMIL
ncbi:MAG: hypothetical protein K0S41_760 [Anaerocolumna sp.]|jgi:hypothetical protein|nr:hypothetical protein [Anaerocolumna sp.]